MSIFIDGFLGIRLYAISPATRFDAKLSIERCLVCSMLQTFFNSSLTVSTSTLFLSSILSYRSISEFFMFFFIFVTRCMSSTKRFSKSSRLMYPLSANIFPKSLWVKSLFFNGSRSSAFLGVRAHCIISPRSLITMCSLKP